MRLNEVNEVTSTNQLLQSKGNPTSKDSRTVEEHQPPCGCNMHVYKGILHARPAVLLNLQQLTTTNGQCLQLLMAQTRLQQSLNLCNDSTTRQHYFKMLQ